MHHTQILEILMPDGKHAEITTKLANTTKSLVQWLKMMVLNHAFSLVENCQQSLGDLQHNFQQQSEHKLVKYHVY